MVKNLPKEVTEQELEHYFSVNFGPVQSCKIAKQPNGQPKPYGFVWFKEGRAANKAILESKTGKCPFKLEWYQILAQRINEQVMKSSGEFKQIFVSWARMSYNSKETITKDDILRIFMKYGTIADVDFQSEKNRALIVYDSHVDAECAILSSSITFKGYSIKCKPATMMNSVTRKPSPRQQPINMDCNIAIKGLDEAATEESITALVAKYGTINKLRIARKHTYKQPPIIYAFVEFSSRTEALAAIKGVNSSKDAPLHAYFYKNNYKLMDDE